MSFSPKEFAKGFPDKSAKSLEDFILAEKILKSYYPFLPEDIDKIFDEKISQNLKNLLKILVQEKKIKEFPKICKEFQKILEDEKIAVSGQVISAEKFPDSEIESLKTKLSKITNMEIVLEEKVDPKIIGGIIIKVGDKTIDNSYSRKIKQLVTSN